MGFRTSLALLLPALAAGTNSTIYGRRALLFGTIAEGAEPRAKGASDPLPIARRADPSAIRQLREAQPPSAPDCARYTANHDGHQKLLEVSDSERCAEAERGESAVQDRDAA